MFLVNEFAFGKKFWAHEDLAEGKDLQYVEQAYPVAREN